MARPVNLVVELTRLLCLCCLYHHQIDHPQTALTVSLMQRTTSVPSGA